MELIFEEKLVEVTFFGVLDDKNSSYDSLYILYSFFYCGIDPPPVLEGWFAEWLKLTCHFILSRNYIMFLCVYIDWTIFYMIQTKL